MVAESQGHRLSPERDSQLGGANRTEGTQTGKRQAAFRLDLNSSGARLTPWHRLRRASSIQTVVPHGESKFENECSLWPAFSARHKAREAASTVLCHPWLGPLERASPDPRAREGVDHPHVNGMTCSNSGRLPSSGSTHNPKMCETTQACPHA